MRFIVATIVLLMAPALAQENVVQTQKGPLLKPAVRVTATVSGDEYRVSRDENNKFIFIAPNKTKTIQPLLLHIEVEK